MKKKEPAENKKNKKPEVAPKKGKAHAGGGASLAQDGQSNMEHTTALQGAPGKKKLS